MNSKKWTNAHTIAVMFGMYIFLDLYFFHEIKWLISATNFAFKWFFIMIIPVALCAGIFLKIKEKSRG